ncbi:hypothetical protein [Levilactobacillus bambusae]|uniref:Polysaccharide polymerase n=1 Tax=Levilactobacillus bambusae TaxID=2024736 RepID=A0A2V1MY83_9LACO|nr:hypothetical protein [Levilactobacillus bambusae]PWF99781.1 hypothetical protein DCM90_06890 [Levilactobacillus bambusae]
MRKMLNLSDTGNVFSPQNGRILFWIAFCSYVFLRSLQTTMFSGLIPHIVSPTISLLVVICIISKVVIFDEFTYRQLLVVVLLLFITLIASRTSQVHSIIYVVLLIVGSFGIEFRSIVKIYFWLTIMVISIAGMGALFHLIPNYIIHTTKGTRYAFGFDYTTDFAAHLFYLSTAYIYLRSLKINLLDCFLLVGVTFFIQVFTLTTTDTLAMMLLFVVVVIYLNQNKIRRHFNWLTRLLSFSYISTFAFAGVIIVLTFFYNPSRRFMVHLNDILSGRLGLGHNAWLANGVSLWGQPISMNGWGGARNDAIHGVLETLTYFYIDSAYIYAILVYGFIMFVVLTFGFSGKMYERINNHDLLFALIVMVITFSAMSDLHFLDVSYNVFLFSFFAYFSNKVTPITKVEEL